MKNSKAARGISIRALNIILLLAAFLAIVFSVFELHQTLTHAQTLYELEQERQKCDKAIQEFMDGSDYLTTQVQQFVIKCERSYMDSYWREVDETKSREAALQTILSANITQAEREMAEASKRESDSLIDGEIWAMRMVSESIGIAESDMPQDVAGYTLQASDAALTDSQKQSAAISYIFGPEYSISKGTIRGNVNAFRNEISNRYSEEAIYALAETQKTAFYTAVAIVILFIVLICAIFCFAGQVASPLIHFSAELSQYEIGRSIRLSENGAREIRQFAKAFNALSVQVDQNTDRLAKMGYVDFLTNVPNRASITEYVTDLIDRQKYPLGIMIIDIDNFKHFNDTYGHTLGDTVLRHVAQAVCSVQSTESGISGRLCGEEFIVVSQDATEQKLREIAEAILQNVRNISKEDIDLGNVPDFRITVSVGGMIWNGEQPSDFIRLLSSADQALYFSKKTGKNKYTYFGELEGGRAF